MVRSRFHHVVTADDAQFGATMKRLPMTANKSAQGINAAMARAGGAMKRATAQTKVLGRAIGSLGPAMAGFLAIGGISKIIQDFDRVGKLAIRFGESAESIQRVSHASKLAGADIEKVATAMQKATRYAQEAIDGNAEYAEAFSRLSINAAEFLEMSLEEKLEAFGDGFVNANSEGEAFNATLSLLGRAGGELVPMFRQGGDAMREAFEDVNPASQKTVDNIQKLNDRWERLKAAVAGPLATIVGGFESVIAIVQATGEALKGVGAIMGELLGGIALGLRQLWDRNFEGAKAAFAAIGDDIQMAMDEAAEKFDEKWKVYEASRGDAPAPAKLETRGGSTGGGSASTDAFAAEVETSLSRLNKKARDGFRAFDNDVSRSTHSSGDGIFTHKEPANRGGGLLGMFARIAGKAMQNPALMMSAKAAGLQGMGFTGVSGSGGLAESARMQAARLAGVGPGAKTSLSVSEGGLGATRALSRERFDARKRAREEAKNQTQGVEKSNELLGSINRNLEVSLSGSVS